MNVKKKARRVMSGLLTAVTVLSTVLSPAVTYASDDAGSVKKIPHYEEIKDQLDENEVVTAKDYEIKVGDNFDVKNDYTGLTIQDDSKVKVTFQEAKDTDGNDYRKIRSQKVLLIRILVLPIRQKQRILRLTRLQRKLMRLTRRAKQN